MMPPLFEVSPKCQGSGQTADVANGDNRGLTESTDVSSLSDNSSPAYRKLTLNRHEVPQEYQDDYIHSGYRRPGMSFVECLLSLFQWNNETLNVWTHYFTLLFFIWKFYSLGRCLVSESSYWPLLAHAIGACTFPTLSCIAHTFSSMTVKIRHICFFCDYAGISLYSIGSMVAYFHYTLPESVQESLLGRLFLPLNVLMAVACCYVCCISRDKKWSQVQSSMRALTFAVPYVFGCSFLLHKIMSKSSQSSWFHCWQFFWCCLMAFTMSSKIPEKYINEYFDIVGHSHQWFHVFVFVGTYHQINAVILDMVDLEKTERGLPSTTFSSSVGLVLLVFIIDAAIIVYFSYKIDEETEENATVEKKEK